MKKFKMIIIGLLMAANICLLCYGADDVNSLAKAEQNLSEEEDYAFDAAMIFKFISEEYAGDDADNKTLLQGAIKGITEELDEYSEFFTTEEYYKFSKSFSSDVYLIGITYTANEEGYPEVQEVIEDSAAKKAGIIEGDIFTELNGEDLKDKAVIDIVDKRVSEGKYDFEIKLLRKGKEKIIKLNAEPVETKSVFDGDLKGELGKKDIDDDIAYIKITSFSTNTQEEFKEIMDENIKNGKKKLILDLRENGGGIIDEALGICDYLVKGEIIKIRKKNHEIIVFSELEGEKPFEKVVVLTDCLTASASELLATALKEDGAEVVGQKSFGKGVIQEVVELKDIGFLKLTTQEYFSKSNKKINRVGVEPDVEVKLPVYIEYKDDEEIIEFNDSRLIEILKYLDYKCATEKEVTNAVKDIQEKMGLAKTGIIDKNTVSAIDIILRAKIANNNLILKKGYEEITKE